MTKAQQTFIDQYTRRLLIDWAHHQVSAGFNLEALEACGPQQCGHGYDVYIEYAKHKGWVSKDGKRVLAKGFSVAASAVKRGNA